MSEKFAKIPDLDLKPCPLCGELLVKHNDHHGEWYAHKQEPGPCMLSFMQIFDKKEADQWNTRHPDLARVMENLCAIASTCSPERKRVPSPELAEVNTLKSYHLALAALSLLKGEK